MNGKLFLLALATTLMTAGSFAQYVKVDPKTVGYGTDVFYGSAFDQSTVTTFKAKIVGISKIPGSGAGEATDTAMLVAPFAMAPDRYGKERMIFSDGYLDVELGPDWFVRDQTTKLHVNDLVEITGSRMVMKGERVVIAQAVRHGHDVLALRRLSGTPYWYAFAQPSPPALPNPPATIGGTNSPIIEEPTAGSQINRVGTSLIYGDAYAISSPGTVHGINIQPLRSIGNPVIIMGNYWYNGPSGYVVSPLYVRY